MGKESKEEISWPNRWLLKGAWSHSSPKWSSKCGKFHKNSRKLNSLIAQEESYWRQQAKICRLKDGDINSKIFHSSTKARKTENTTTSLMKIELKVHSHKKMSNVDISYFKWIMIVMMFCTVSIISISVFHFMITIHF